MSETVRTHIPCKMCGSSDGATEYTDHTYCFVCEAYIPHNIEGKHKSSRCAPIISDSDMQIRALKRRGITADTCRKYNYYITQDDYGRPIQVANYIKDNTVIFQKTRDKDKKFSIRGQRDYVFFGQSLFSGGLKLVITEGEIDCLTVSQVQQNKYPVVSLPFGAASAVATFKANQEWLEGFAEVIVMFDMDAAGQKAVNSIGGILSPHKLKVAELPLKDPNECLLAGRSEEIIRAIWNAKEYRPDGIINAKDLKDALFSKEAEIKTFTFPWGEELNKRTHGIRMGEILLLTAGSGIGKSTMAREIAYKCKMRDNVKIGMIMLEENPKKTLRDMLSIHLKKPLHLTWNSIDKTTLSTAYDEVFGDGNVVLYDHFGSIESNNLLQKIRYLIVIEECKVIVLDHISIAISGLEGSGTEERKDIDRLMTSIRSLVEETGAAVIIISHLKKSDSSKKSFEEGGAITLDDLRGSAGLKQLSDTVIALERNQQADNDNDKNVMKIRVLKCRFTGDTGLADKLRFNKSKNILEEVDNLEINEGGVQDSCPF